MLECVFVSVRKLVVMQGGSRIFGKVGLWKRVL